MSDLHIELTNLERELEEIAFTLREVTSRNATGFFGEDYRKMIQSYNKLHAMAGRVRAIITGKPQEDAL